MPLITRDLSRRELSRDRESRNCTTKQQLLQYSFMLHLPAFHKIKRSPGKNFLGSSDYTLHNTASNALNLRCKSFRQMPLLRRPLIMRNSLASDSKHWSPIYAVNVSPWPWGIPRYPSGHAPWTVASLCPRQEFYKTNENRRKRNEHCTKHWGKPETTRGV